MFEAIPVTDRESWLAMRQKDVTASVVGCLLGVHEYTTAYELAALKSGRISSDPEETAPMKRGRLLEPVAVELLREERPDWRIERGQHYWRDPVARLGATPDVLAFDPERGPGVVQIKSVERGVYSRKWRQEDGSVQPPLWIAVQAMLEAHATGRNWAVVCPLVVGFGVEMPIIPVPIIPGVIERIYNEVRLFWAIVDSGELPPPDYRRDADVIDALFPENGETVDLTGDNRIMELLTARSISKGIQKREKEVCETIDAEILDKLQGATVGIVSGGRSITHKTIFRKGYEVKPTNYRQLRCPDV